MDEIGYGEDEQLMFKKLERKTPRGVPAILKKDCMRLWTKPMWPRMGSW
jgi:hypothetical protein